MSCKCQVVYSTLSRLRTIRYHIVQFKSFWEANARDYIDPSDMLRASAKSKIKKPLY